MARTLTEDDIQRRVEFLIGEAKQDRPIRDRSVTFTMRTVSNYSCVMCDCDSNYLKLNCRYRSLKAHDAFHHLSKVNWLKFVTNEHQEPLERIWNWMCHQKDKLDPPSVLNRFGKWPVVIVTIEENRSESLRLPLSKWPTDWTPANRYREAGIELLFRDDRGDWVRAPPS
jgi:hypothetical protein